jgi:hypothetical protein
MKRAGFLLLFVGLALGLAGPAHARIAFIRDGHVHTADDDGSRVKRLAKGDLVELSPDGRWMVYSRFVVRGSRWETWLARAHGAGKKRITRARDPLEARFSPDSKLVTFTYPDRLVLLHLATRARAVLARGQVEGVSFAPSSQAVVFEQLTTPDPDDYGTGPRDLWVSVLDGSAPQPLTADGRSLNPLWTRQGIVFNRQELVDGDAAPLYQLFQADPATGAVTQLSTRPVRDHELVSGPVAVGRSPDGTRLLVAITGQSQATAVAADLPTGTLRDFGSVDTIPVGLSRDGDRVLLQTGGLDPTSRHNLVVADWVTGKRRTVLRNAHSASWTG